MAIDSSKTLSSLNSSTKELNSSFQKLSSGKRINKASDDAAGLAIVSQLEASVKTSLQGARNSVDAISVTSIADSALSTVSDITSRQTELAEQAANGTLSDDQRQSLNSEFQQLEQEKSRILSSTQFNGVNVFSGTSVQAGSTGDASSQINIAATDTSAITNSSIDISTQGAARSALDSLSSQTQNIASQRGTIGASANRLDVAEANNRSNAVESETAASRIRDTDVADETAKLTSASIKQQVSSALAAQVSKLNADSVLKLLS